MSEQILKIYEVQSITGLSRTTIYRMVSANTFPKQIKLGERSSGWLKSEVEAWLNNRIATSRRSHHSSTQTDLTA